MHTHFKKVQSINGLLVQMAVLQVMADYMSSAAALVWSKRRIEDLHQCFCSRTCAAAVNA